MFCTECGNEIGDDDLFCPECGTKVGLGEEPQNEESEGSTELLTPVTPAESSASEDKTQLLSAVEDRSEQEPAGAAQTQTYTKAPEKPKADNTKALKISLIVGCIVAVVLLVLVILAATKPSIEFLKDTPFSSVTSQTQATDESENSGEENKSDNSEEEKKTDSQATKEAEKTKTYVLENSSTKELTNSDISGLTDDQICIAQNEIWARHGRKFKNNWLQDYFNKQSWYSGIIEADEFLNKYSPSDVENKNAQFLNSVLSSRGYDLNKVHPN